MISDSVKRGFERAPHRALLKACGLTDADMDKPFIAIAGSYIDIVPGHVHLQEVAELVEEAISNHAYTCLYKPLDMAAVLQLVGEISDRKQRAG